MIHINLLPRKRKAAKVANRATPVEDGEKKRSSGRLFTSLLPLVAVGVGVYIIGSFVVDYTAVKTQVQRDQTAVAAMLVQNAKLAQQVQPGEAALTGQDALLTTVGTKTDVSGTLAQLVQRLPAGTQVNQITLDKSACTLSVVFPNQAAETLFLHDLNTPPFSSPSYQSSSQDAKGSITLTNLTFAILPAGGGS